MPLVMNTYNDYFFYLQYRRRAVSLTVRANKLALRYFSMLYGYADTKELLPVHMVRFHEYMLKKKRIQRNDKGEYVNLSKYSVYKIMVKLRAFVKRLESERLLGDLKPIDVPVGSIPRPLPKYIPKSELTQIMRYLEERVHNSLKGKKKVEIYNAHLSRALIRFLYTTGLRNTELRTLKLRDINIEQLIGQVLGKGNKFAAITFSTSARLQLEKYLAIRKKMFPGRAFEFVFTPYGDDTKRIFTEQAINRVVKTIGINAGVPTKTNVHIFRHSLGTHLVQDGYNLAQVRDKLRHTSLTVTNMYVHSNPVDQISMTKEIDNSFLYP